MVAHFVVRLRHLFAHVMLLTTNPAAVAGIARNITYHSCYLGARKVIEVPNKTASLPLG